MLVLKDRLLVELDAPPAMQGLVIIPDSSRDPSYTGKVLAIGPEQLELAVGERVVFSRYAGVPIEEKAGKPVKVIVDSREVLAVLESGPAKLVDRTTVAVSGYWLRSVLGDPSGEFSSHRLLYVHYDHSTDSLYVTMEVPSC